MFLYKTVEDHTMSRERGLNFDHKTISENQQPVKV